MYKIGKTLMKLGWTIKWCGTHDKFDYYEDELEYEKINTLGDLQNLSADYNYVIFGNPHTAWCVNLKHNNKLCAVGDVVALRESTKRLLLREEKTFRELKGLMFVSEQQLRGAEEYYNLELRDKSIIIYNGILKEWVPEIRCRLVWSGNLYHYEHSNHRQIMDRLLYLAKSEHIEINLYPGQLDYPKEYLKGLPDNIILHKRVPAQEVVKELSQYDAGLCIYNESERSKLVMNTSMPNKLFEYRAAGLPVYCDDLEAMREWGEMDEMVMVKTLDEIEEAAAEIVGDKMNRMLLCTYDTQAERLERFILDVEDRADLADGVDGVN